MVIRKIKGRGLGNRVLGGARVLNQLFLTPIPRFYSRVSPGSSYALKAPALYITGGGLRERQHLWQGSHYRDREICGRKGLHIAAPVGNPESRREISRSLCGFKCNDVNVIERKKKKKKGRDSQTRDCCFRADVGKVTFFFLAVRKSVAISNWDEITSSHICQNIAIRPPSWCLSHMLGPHSWRSNNRERTGVGQGRRSYHLKSQLSWPACRESGAFTKQLGASRSAHRKEAGE